MFVKNQDFSDEDTLLEMLFDFGLGDPSPFMQQIIADVRKRMDTDKGFNVHLQTLGEEDRTELYNDIQQEQLAQELMEQFASFSVYKAGLYGVKENTEKVLLYQIDLY